MNTRGFICWILVLCSIIVSGQNFDRNDFFEADMAMMDKNYPAAQMIFERLLLSEPDNANLNYLNGYCLINIQGRKKESIKYFEKAVPKATAEYKEGSHKETNAPLEAIKYYAMACKYNNNIPKAIELFNQYKSTLETKKKDEIAEIDAQIAACHTSMRMQENPVYYRIHELGDQFESDESQVYPVVNKDETMLFYMVPGKNNRDDIYFSKKENGEWSKPVKITVFLGLKEQGYPSSVSNDNQRLYLTVKQGLSTDIFYSEFYRGHWKKMIKVEKPVSGKTWDSQAFESADGNYLYFSSDRKGGFGNMDLYRSEKNSKGEWGNPVNLGEQINTPYNELMPMVNSDQTKLYFKSEGHENLGGYDIFFSEKTGDDWGIPVNIGYSINTPDDDIYFMPTDNEIYAFAAEQDPSNGSKFELKVIEMFSEKNPRIFVLSGIVVLQDGDGFEDSKIEVYNKDTYQNLVSTQPELYTGVYHLEIPAGNYEINYTRPGYKTYSQLVNLPMNNPEGEQVINAFLEKEESPIEEIPVIAEAVAENTVPEQSPYSEPETESEPQTEIAVYKEPEPVDVPAVVETTDETVNSSNYVGKYTVQFLATTERKEMDFLGGEYKVEIQKGTDKYYRYTTGVFNSVGEAESTQRSIASNYYQDAFIRFHNLDNYLNQAAVNPSTVYTIQIMALKEDTSPIAFSKLDNLKVSHGEDGWYRYTTGEFNSLAAARQALNDLIGKGYKDAYIKRIIEVLNY